MCSSSGFVTTRNKAYHVKPPHDTSPLLYFTNAADATCRAADVKSPSVLYQNADNTSFEIITSMPVTLKIKYYTRAYKISCTLIFDDA